MSRLTLNEFRTAFRSVLTDTDEVVVVYSALWGFGHRFGLPPAKLVELLIEAMLQELGSGRTLVMPTYVADFPKSRVYDLVRSKPYTGILPDRFRFWPGVQRSKQPMDNYAVLGPRSDELLAQTCTTAWGDDSVLGWFDRVNARHVIFGVAWHLACAYCHRCEEVVGVPFRYFKRFSGALFSDGMPIGPCQEIMYVRPFDVEPMLSYHPIRDRLGDQGLVLEGQVPDFQMQSSLSSDILRVSVELLSADPLIFIKNRSGIENWIKDGRTQELARLLPEQHPPFAQRPVIFPNMTKVITRR